MADFFSMQDASVLLKPEAADTHKYQRGTVLVIAGSSDYSGAPFLVGESVLRSGAGLCTIAIPEGCHPFCAIPKALIVRTVPGTCGHFSENSIEQLVFLASKASCLAIGPGLTASTDIYEVLSALFALKKPMILDADALNLMAQNPSFFWQIQSETILTPHAGEFCRLTESLAVDNLADFAKKSGCVTVLKGAHTQIMTPDGILSTNSSGCPALSTAGSGDCLTGIIAAFVAQGYSAYDAARLGVFLHGLAGDILGEKSTRGCIADDIPNALKKAFETIAATSGNYHE